MILAQDDCQDIVTLNNSTLSDANYRALEVIHSNAVIADNAEVTFAAGDSIILKPGFRTGINSTFSTKIGLTTCTLCEGYGGETPTTILGTTITASSQLGSITLSGNVSVQGDFLIDDPQFTFLDAIVEIDQGVEIRVGGGRTLTLDNSKFFSCDDSFTPFWKGFFVGSLGVITTQNGTRIEDALAAIKAESVVTINLNNTLFNRNEIGVEIDFNDFTALPPTINVGNDVKFATSTNLSNTASKGSAGIKIEDTAITIGTLGSDGIIFDNLIRGIHATYSGTFLASRPTVIVTDVKFRNLNYCIDMESGGLDLKACTFQDYFLFGISLDEVRNVDIDNCTFEFTTDYDAPFNSTESTAVCLENFEFNSLTEIDNSTFDLTNSTKEARGVYLKGGSVGNGTEISISNNNFYELSPLNTTLQYDGLRKGVTFDGIFTSADELEVDFNNFILDYGKIGVLSELNAIEAINGDKSNLIVYENTFDKSVDYPDGSANKLIKLEGSGSLGSNIQIQDNTIPINDDFFLESGGFIGSFGFFVKDFQNATFCQNFVGDSGEGIFLQGNNVGTDLSANTFVDITARKLLVDGIIGEQFQKGNVWYRKYANVRPETHARLASDNSQINRITVHTPPEETRGYPTTPTHHPINIAPTFGWFVEQAGIPGTDCSILSVSESNGVQNFLYDVTASGNLVDYESNPTTIWNVERNLYEKIRSEAGFQSFYQDFYNTNQNGQLGQFSEVSFAIHEILRNSLDRELTNSDALELQRKAVLAQIKEINSSIFNGDEVANTIEQKRNLLYQLQSVNRDLEQLAQQYKSEVSAALQSVMLQNNNLLPQTTFEENEQVVNRIYLKQLIQQRDTLTENEIIALQAIASQCPKYGGFAVYQARGILPQEHRLDYDDESSDCYPFPTSSLEQRQSSDLAKQQNNNLLELFPNPTQGFLTLSTHQEEFTQVLIYDITGKVVRRMQASHNEVMIDVSDLKTGVYFCHVLFEDGDLQVKKLFVK